MYSWNTYAVFSITWLHNELKKKIKTLNANISKYHPYIIGNKVWDLSQKKLPPEQSFSSLWYSAKIEVCSKYIILGENLEALLSVYHEVYLSESLVVYRDHNKITLKHRRGARIDTDIPLTVHFLPLHLFWNCWSNT